VTCLRLAGAVEAAEAVEEGAEHTVVRPVVDARLTHERPRAWVAVARVLDALDLLAACPTPEGAAVAEALLDLGLSAANAVSDRAFACEHERASEVLRRYDAFRLSTRPPPPSGRPLR
jgi:hypothetical protein